MTSYRDIIKQSWKISWKNKYLWFFGFFASIISFGAEFKVLSKSINQEQGIKMLNDTLMFFKTGIFSKTALLNMIELIKTEPMSAIAILSIMIFIIAFALFFLWLATVSQISIINSVKNLVKGTKDETRIKKNIKKANKKFWPVLSMNIIIGIIINGVTLLISYLLVLSLIKESSVLNFVYALLFVLMIPLILIASFVFKYAIAYIVVEGKKFRKSLKDAWKLFKENWMISIEMAITLFFINIIAMFVISAITLLILMLFIGLAMTSSVFVASPQVLFWTLLVLAILISMAVMIIGGAIINTFQISSWTNLFLKIKDKKTNSKIERIFLENENKEVKS
jgi:hypothetical protein